MREAVDLILAQSDAGHEFAHPPSALNRVCDPEVAQRFADHVTDPHARIEGGERILKHELQMPPHLAQPFAAKRGKIIAAKVHGSGSRLVQADDRAADRGFAAA